MHDGKRKLNEIFKFFFSSIVAACNRLHHILMHFTYLWFMFDDIIWRCRNEAQARTLSSRPGMCDIFSFDWLVILKNEEIITWVYNVYIWCKFWAGFIQFQLWKFHKWLTHSMCSAPNEKNWKRMCVWFLNGLWMWLKKTIINWISLIHPPRITQPNGQTLLHNLPFINILELSEKVMRMYKPLSLVTYFRLNMSNSSHQLLTYSSVSTIHFGEKW